MILNTITIILSSVVIFMAIVTPFVNPFFRFRKANANKSATFETNESEDGQSESEEITEAEEDVASTSDCVSGKPITVLITAHNNAPELERHLPQFLSQVYEPGYEIIVVAEKGDGETEDVLKRHIADKHLYYTFIPDSSRYMSRKKLAITLGVKAARYEWIVLTDACCTPYSDNWLKTIASHCSEEHNLLIGYSNYDNENFNRMNVYLGGGMGFQISALQITVGYDYGMMNQYKGDNAPACHRSNLKLGVGLAF